MRKIVFENSVHIDEHTHDWKVALYKGGKMEGIISGNTKSGYYLKQFNGNVKGGLIQGFKNAINYAASCGFELYLMD